MKHETKKWQNALFLSLFVKTKRERKRDQNEFRVCYFYFAHVTFICVASFKFRSFLRNFIKVT